MTCFTVLQFFSDRVFRMRDDPLPINLRKKDDSLPRISRMKDDSYRISRNLLWKPLSISFNRKHANIILRNFVSWNWLFLDVSNPKCPDWLFPKRAPLYPIFTWVISGNVCHTFRPQFTLWCHYSVLWTFFFWNKFSEHFSMVNRYNPHKYICMTRWLK